MMMTVTERVERCVDEQLIRVIAILAKYYVDWDCQITRYGHYSLTNTKP